MKKHLLLVLAFVAACGKSSKSDKAAPALDAAQAHAAIDAAPKATDGPSTMTITPAAAIEAGKPVKLTVELKGPDGARITKLAVMHEKQLHLIVVDETLMRFDHIHPEQQPDGTLVVEHTFPAAGRYLAFGDFTPDGGKQTVARTELAVTGEDGGMKLDITKMVKPLPTTVKPDGFEVTLASADALVPNGDVVLAFTIKSGGKVVTDLQNYLGARGHCVIISADTEHYLHSHPLTDATPDVQFHTQFPAAGVYAVWAEFRPNGAALRVNFVIEVKDGGAVAVTDAPDAGMHDHHTPVPVDAGAAKPAPDAEPVAAAPDAAPAPDVKISAAEQKAWNKAKPVFEQFCAECHTADGAKKSARKLAKFDMSTYPLAGKDASPADLRKVLGIGGGKATMPKGKVGAVAGDDLAAIAAWADAYDKAHP